MVGTWNELSDRGKTLLLVAAGVEVSLALTAWVDLARRPASSVVGPKRVWAVVIAVNVVGPITYFVAGRRRFVGEGGSRTRPGSPRRRQSS